MVDTINSFIKNNTIAPQAVVRPDKLPFPERKGGCKNATGKRLYEIMEAKKTNLVVAADLTKCVTLLSINGRMNYQLFIN